MNGMNWSVRICGDSKGGALSIREIGGLASKREAFDEAMRFRAGGGHTPIVRDGRCYVVRA